MGMIRAATTILVVAALPHLLMAPVTAGEWSGKVEWESRGHLRSADDRSQREGGSTSLAFQPEFEHIFESSGDAIVLKAFGRLDEADHRRSHADLREAYWEHVGDTWDVQLGVNKVFWGVTESVHLVDIINQTDGLEHPDGEDKLGQPMIRLGWQDLPGDAGSLEAFVLPGVRTRSFPGARGRLRSIPRVDTHGAIFESSRRRRHVDAALRWSHTLDEFDIGLAHFAGTARAPRFIPGIRPSGEVVLRPLYDQIAQTSLDVQWTQEGWLLKLEALHHDGRDQYYNAAVAGFEYTLVGLADTDMDLGLLGEYLFDDRGDKAPGPFEDDIFVGGRLVLNDVASTEVLLGLIQDMEGEGLTAFIEASRRLGEAYTVEVQAYAARDTPPASPLAVFRRDGFVQISLSWHF
ncbi:hypothetical protein JYT83_00805 [bacterium AH-315-F18]|nr:hypothetical protein [bacterium AH-315-F18]